MTDATAIPTTDELMTKLAEVKDPEINLSIVELGLVYDISFDNGDVIVTMTLTSPGCPLGPVIRGEAYAKLRENPRRQGRRRPDRLEPPVGPPHHGQRRRQDAARYLVVRGLSSGASIALGVAIGAGIGAALGNVAIGIAIGVSVGVALGVAVEERLKRQERHE